MGLQRNLTTLTLTRQAIFMLKPFAMQTPSATLLHQCGEGRCRIYKYQANSLKASLAIYCLFRGYEMYAWGLVV